MENVILPSDKRVRRSKDDISTKDEVPSQFKDDLLLADERITLLENGVSAKSELLLKRRIE